MKLIYNEFYISDENIVELKAVVAEITLRRETTSKTAVEKFGTILPTSIRILPTQGLKLTLIVETT